jgi:glyoxylase-like metal-dependent hydrolase (beta-lactamase superfamily II)
MIWFAVYSIEKNKEIGMLRRVLSKIIFFLTAVFISTAVFAQSAEQILKNASRAMGADKLKTIRYVNEGTGYTFGQAYQPGGAWPKITVHNQTRTINYDTASMREEITISRAEPKGGGGYPLSGQQRTDQYLSGNFAWNVANNNPVPGPRFVTDRTHQLWITPHGAIKAAMKNKPKVKFDKSSGKSLAIISFTVPMKFTADIYLDENNLVKKVESTFADPVLGDTAAVTTYSDYHDYNGVKFPGKIQQSMGGFPVLDVAVKEVQPNVPVDIALPDAVKNAVEKVTTEKVADGVWFVAGGSHNSVAIEMGDYLILVESPLNDMRAIPVIETVKALVPNKPLRYMINSHNHFDHSGGVRTAVAEGMTIVTQVANKDYFQKVLANPSKINPDAMAKSDNLPNFLPVEDLLVLENGGRTVEVHRIKDSVHGETLMMVYLPKEKLLIEADAFTPPAPNTPPPAQPNANNVNLVENIERLKLSVDKILPLHGRVVPIGDLYAVIKPATPAPAAAPAAPK